MITGIGYAVVHAEEEAFKAHVELGVVLAAGLLREVIKAHYFFQF